MQIGIITIFPSLFRGVFDSGIIQQAQKKRLLTIEVNDLREFSDDKHRSVDDRPYGGGAGMILRPQPIFQAVESCKGRFPGCAHVILLTPQGRRFDQAKAKELSLKRYLILICGRYEGVDQRVADHLVDEKISIGDYVLSGGEFPALVVIDAVSRLIPGAVGEGSSVLMESFMDGLLDYPHYTRPAEFRGWKVPEVLLSGNHRSIELWRSEESLKRTREKRPDLLEGSNP